MTDAVEPITREERDAAVELIERYAEFEKNNFGAHRITTASLTVVAALSASEAREKKLKALVHEGCKMLATLGEQMGDTEEDKHEIEEYQARARQALGE